MRSHPKKWHLLIPDVAPRGDSLQLGQLRLNPPGLGSKCGKRVERFSDFGKYKGNFRNHTTSLPTYRTLSKWGKWVDRLSDFGKYKGYITGCPISQTSLCFCYFLGFWSKYRGTSDSHWIAHEILISKLTLLSFLREKLTKLRHKT